MTGPRARSPGPAEAGNSFQVRIETSSPAETETLGRRLGALLRPGDVVALSGDLGAGKTVFARGLAAGAGATGYMASPTFTLIREYRGPSRVYHVDLYRLDRSEQLDDLGLDELLDGSGIVVIEWAEKAVPRLPPDHLWITIRFLDREDARELTLTPKGTRYAGMIEKLAKA